MLKNILKYKKIFVAIIVIIVVVIVLVVGIAKNKGSEGVERPDDNNTVKTEEEQNDEKDNGQVADDKEESFNENGLDVKEDTTGTVVDSIDGSGSWDDADEGNNNTNNSNDNNKTDDTEGNVESKENILQEDELVDDKEWSDIR